MRFIRHAVGELKGYSKILRDLTAEKHGKERLQRSGGHRSGRKHAHKKELDKMAAVAKQDRDSDTASSSALDDG